MARVRRTAVCCAALAATLALTACGKPEQSSPSTTPPPAVAAVAESDCVAPPCDDSASGSKFSYWRAGDSLPVGAFSGRAVDSNGQPVPSRTLLRFWSPSSSWSTWTKDGGRFALIGSVQSAEYDVDAVFPSGEFPDRRDGRFHLGTLRAGDRDVVLRLPVARSTIATGTLVDADGRALAGWRILAHRKSDGVAAISEFTEAVTEDNGRFSVLAWSKPEFVLEIRTAHGVHRSTERSELVGAGGELRLTAGPPGVFGKLVVEDGASPVGAIVRMRDIASGFERRVTAEPNGTFDFTQVDERVPYELTAELAGHVCLASVRHVADWPDARVFLTGLGQILEGAASEVSGRPLRFAWVRFVAADRTRQCQTLTDIDGRFFTNAASPVDYDAFLLAPGPDGRLVPGPNLGRCRGGDRNLELRVAR